MANRRMFSRDITLSDAFLDMPPTTQLLYFHLGMEADDDGFIGAPKRVMRYIGASDDDMRILLTKRFLLAFDSGVVVVKHWKINNLIKKDRYHKTQYQEELSTLSLKENKAYTEADKRIDLGILPDVLDVEPEWNPNGTQMEPEVRLGKVRLGKEEPLSGKPDYSAQTKEIVSYLNERIGANYRSSSKKTASLINARLNEGFTVDDFKAVIDTKASDWLGDSKMSRYLRPETLFGTKFEGYLQEAKAVRRDDERFAKYA